MRLLSAIKNDEKKCRKKSMVNRKICLTNSPYLFIFLFTVFGAAFVISWVKCELGCDDNVFSMDSFGLLTPSHVISSTEGTCEGIYDRFADGIICNAK